MNTNALYASLKNIVECRPEVTHVELTLFNDKLNGVTLEVVQSMVDCIYLLSTVANGIKHPWPHSPIGDAIIGRFNTILLIAENYERKSLEEELSTTENDEWFWSGFNGELYTYATEICAYFALANMGPFTNPIGVQNAQRAISKFLGIDVGFAQQFFQTQQQCSPFPQPDPRSQQPFQPNPRW